MNKSRVLLAMVLTLVMSVEAMAQCGARSVDFGNANLGAQLCQGGNCNLTSQIQSFDGLDSQLSVAQHRELERLVAMRSQMEETPYTNVAYRRQGAAAASASAGGTSPGALTFRESVQPVPEISSADEVAEMRAMIAELREELNYQRSMARQTGGDRVMYLTGGGGGGAAASASTSASAPSQSQIAFTAPAPSAQSRNSQSACSSGGCGGGGGRLFGRLGGGRQVSRSRSFSSTTTN